MERLILYSLWHVIKEILKILNKGVKICMQSIHLGEIMYLFEWSRFLQYIWTLFLFLLFLLFLLLFYPFFTLFFSSFFSSPPLLPTPFVLGIDFWDTRENELLYFSFQWYFWKEILSSDMPIWIPFLTVADIQSSTCNSKESLLCSLFFKMLLYSYNGFTITVTLNYNRWYHSMKN